MRASDAYRIGETRWRRAEEASLKREDGWLATAGLFWLGDRPVTIGNAPGSDVRLPRGPAGVGTAVLWGGKVVFGPETGGGATLDGQPVAGITEMRSDAEGRPSVLKVGSLRLTVIQRGGRIGFRLHDPLAATRREFRSLRWYPVDPKYRIVARFIPFAKPRTIQITNVLGDVRQAPCPGYAEFRLEGRTVRLYPEATPEGLFFDFRDRTSGRETYGAGRFLDAPKPANGRVVLDFNRAVNPPCAFTAFATCPLPPEENALPIAIHAGALSAHPE